uniref:Uncharacterized protein n=1 Tax=Falco tinnunculus TaxID=100819 RepID=A0A8C4XLK1_FALTI
MASLYQRFSGKINTSRSFPVPPEASHLLGAQSTEEDGAAGKTPRPLQQESSRPRFQYQPRSDCEEEDVSAGGVRVGLGRVSGVPPLQARTRGSKWLLLGITFADRLWLWEPSQERLPAGLPRSEERVVLAGKLPRVVVEFPVPFPVLS